MDWETDDLDGHDDPPEWLRKLEDAVQRHWQTFRAACEADGVDEVTFLSALGVNVGQLLLEYPDFADAWIWILAQKVQDERRLMEQEPS